MGWGSGGWGSVPWGAAFGAGPSIRLAIVSGRNSIDVEWSAAVKAFDPTTANDSLNPANWFLSAVDPTTALIPFVQYVEVAATDADGGATTIRIFFDADLDDGATYNIVANPAIVASDGVTAIGSPNSYDVIVPTLGFVPVINTIPRELRTDWKSTTGAKAVSGTIRWDETGDLANESGITYLRKRIMRRMSTLRGAFFHLPNYGAGRRLKTLITPSDLANYEAEAKAQVLLEPDVIDAVVTVDRLAPNIARTTIRPTNIQGELLPEIVLVQDFGEA